MGEDFTCYSTSWRAGERTRSRGGIGDLEERQTGGGFLASIRRAIGCALALVLVSVLACAFLGYLVSGKGNPAPAFVPKPAPPSQAASHAQNAETPTVNPAPVTAEGPKKATDLPLPKPVKVESVTEPQPQNEPADPDSSLRTWSDITGSFKVEAEFVSYSPGRVKLRKGDGSEVTVPLERLSEADAEFIREKWREKGLRPPF